MKDIIEVRLARLAVVALLFVGSACTPYAPTPTSDGDVIVNQNVTVGQGGSTGGGQGTPGSGTCNPVASLGVSLLGTGGLRTADIRVGQSVTLDSTPRDSQNQIRPDSCNVATPILWRLNPTAGICSLNNETTYTPTLTGIGVGKCEAFSQIGSVTASIPVAVNVRQ